MFSSFSQYINQPKAWTYLILTSMTRNTAKNGVKTSDDSAQILGLKQ